MKSWSWHLADEAATRRLGAELAEHLHPGDLLCLSGELGAGKTCLTKGLISALSGLDPDEVTSPSFCLAQDYDEAKPPVRHLDAYRLGGPEALLDLGFLDWLAEGDFLVILEWPERVTDALPESYLTLELCHENQSRRATATIQGELPSIAAALDELAKEPKVNP